MDVYYNRAREWSRSARLFATFVERKADLDNDVAKATSKAVRQALDGLDEQKLLSAGTLSTSVLAILREQDSVAARQLEVANKIRAEVLQPLVYACRSPAAPSTRVTLASDARPTPPPPPDGTRNQREEHDRARKRMLTEYEKEKRKHVDNEAQLARVKARYVAQSQVSLADPSAAAPGRTACRSVGGIGGPRAELCGSARVRRGPSLPSPFRSLLFVLSFSFSPIRSLLFIVLPFSFSPFRCSLLFVLSFSLFSPIRSLLFVVLSFSFSPCRRLG